MNAVPSTGSSCKTASWLAVVLALFTATAYILIAQGILGVGDLQLGDDAIAILNAAAGGCLLGGLLLLTRRRWLWLAGLVMNGLVILFYFRMYQGRPAVYLSPGGLASRSAELLLEVALILLLLTDWMKARRRPA